MGFQTSTWNVNGKRSTCFNTVSFLTYLLLKTGTYLSVVSLRISYEYTLEISYFDKQKRKQHASQGDDASTAEAVAGNVGRGEQGEARRASSTPNGGPHLELAHFLARLRLKTWYKSDFSIAHTTPHSSLYVSSYQGQRVAGTDDACDVGRHF